MNRKKKGWWLVGGCLLVVLAVVLLAAIAAHATGLAHDQQEAAVQRARFRCPTSTPTGAGVDQARVAQLVQAILANSPTSITVPDLDAPEQIPNAKTIVATSIAMQIPARGQVIALATALQESDLRNLTYGDRDSLGLFQQRPSQGWGSREQILDPVYASTQFYNALKSVDGWEQLPLTVAAQRVQKSGYPDAYAKHEILATALQQAIAPSLNTAPAAPAQVVGRVGGGGCGVQQAADFGTIPPGTLPAGYQIPADAPLQVRTAIQWALGQLGTPYQWGGSCTAPHGNDPAGRCDCSSLVQRAYGVAGISLPRQTYDQVNEGIAVPVSELRPGDLVFTEGTAARPEHVAMAIGSGLLVQAPHTGEVVKVSEISQQGAILAARRVVAG